MSVEKTSSQPITNTPAPPSTRVDLRLAPRLICNTENKCETGGQFMGGMSLPLDGNQVYVNITVNGLKKFSFEDNPSAQPWHPQVFLQATPLFKIFDRTQLIARLGIGGDWLIADQKPTDFGIFLRIGGGLLITVAKDPEGLNALLGLDLFAQNKPGTDDFALISRATFRMTFNLSSSWSIVAEPRVVLNSDAAPRAELVLGPQMSFFL